MALLRQSFFTSLRTSAEGGGDGGLVDEGVLGGGTLLPAQHGDGLPGGETDQLVLSKSILC